MIAIDTNVLVRLLTNDGAAEAERARRVLEDAVAFVPVTVALELEWVLRSAYGYSAAQVRQAFETLLSIETLVFEHEDRVALATRALAEGLDFADALHVASAAHTERFVTFDAALIARASRVSAVPPVQAPA